MTVGLRPKALRLDMSKNNLKLEIHERLGGISYAYLMSPTTEKIIVEMSDDNEMSAGQDVGLSFELAALFFDSENGQRLR